MQINEVFSELFTTVPTDIELVSYYNFMSNGIHASLFKVLQIYLLESEVSLLKLAHQTLNGYAILVYL